MKDRFMKRKRTIVAVTFALGLLLGLFSVAQASEEDRDNLPRVADNGSLRVEILSPTHDGPNAGTDIIFRFKVTDLTGKPQDNLQLTFTATRDYSGQVKKEHNSPRDPIVGPFPFVATGTPGEYTITANFWHNGHWQIEVGGASLNGQKLRYTQAVAYNLNDGSGFNWDWLIWPGMLLLALAIVFFISRKKDQYGVPVEELVEVKEPVSVGGK
jgi:hypothetical protein